MKIIFSKIVPLHLVMKILRRHTYTPCKFCFRNISPLNACNADRLNHAHSIASLCMIIYELVFIVNQFFIL